MSAQNRKKLTFPLCPQNVHTGSTPSPLSMRTHYKFRKIGSFCDKSADVRTWRTSPLSSKCPHWTPPL